jgi:TRAP-type uncharacterized transport system substrate-binding protein
MGKKIMVFVFVWILGFSLGSMAVAKEVEVRLAGITMTSDTYMLGVGWSNVIKKYLPEVRMKVLAEGGTTKLLRGVVNKQWEIGYIGTAHLECARKEIADLKNKKVHLGNPGGFGGIVTKGVFRGHGLDIDKGDYKGIYLATSQAMDQLRDKAGLDDALVWGGIPQPLIEQLSSQIPVRLIGMTQEGFAKFQKDFPVGPYTPMITLSPAKIKEAYKGKVVNTEAVHTWGIPLMLVVRKEMDEALVYKMVKTFWEHLKEVESVSKQLEGLNLKEAIQGLSAPFHPGALKYYKEIGAIK